MKNADSWQRLTALARTVPAPLSPTDPADDARFAAGVVRRWLHPPAPTAAGLAASASVPRGLPWEAWSLRGVLAAGVTAALMLAWNLPLLSPDNTPADLLPPDPVAELAAAF